jgi:hypothetical protein
MLWADLSMSWFVLGFNLVPSSSTVSGGGFMLLSSNSATTVSGRNDLDKPEDLSARAIVN